MLESNGKEAAMDEPRQHLTRIVHLGGATFAIERDEAGGFVVRRSDGTVIIPPFNADEAHYFARVMREVADADALDE